MIAGNMENAGQIASSSGNEKRPQHMLRAFFVAS
jgi:hypothetical protein